MTKNLIEGQYTAAAMNIYLAVFEDRNWDCYYNFISNKGIYNYFGGRAYYQEEWY